MRRELPQQLLRELLRDSKSSDRELAKILKVTQPTITRARHKLEKNGMIQGYTVIPNFREMGFEILALTFVKMRSGNYTKEIMDGGHERARKYLGEQPNIIFVASGEGLGMTGVMVSFHKSYTEYHSFLNKLRLKWTGFVDLESFIVSLKEVEFKKFSLTYLGDEPLQLDDLQQSREPLARASDAQTDTF